jgi:NADH-quinone oxidoreductase subunit M
MIAISVGFGIFPMHLYDVVRSGVDPLVAKITLVVPVAENSEELSVKGQSASAARSPQVPLIVNHQVPLTPDSLRGSE